MGNDRDPDFLYVAPSKTACAAFSKESRMKFASAAKVHRKPGSAVGAALRRDAERFELYRSANQLGFAIPGRGTSVSNKSTQPGRPIIYFE